MNEAQPPRGTATYHAAGRRRTPPDRPTARNRGGAPTTAGLGALPACLLSVALAAVGAIIDAMANNSVTMLFTAVFVLDAIVIALVVRHGDMISAVIMPPIAFFIALVVGSKVEKGDATSSGSTLAWLGIIGTRLGEHMVALLIGTGAAILIVLARYVRTRRAAA